MDALESVILRSPCPSRRGHSISSLYKLPKPTSSSLFPAKNLVSLRKWNWLERSFSSSCSTPTSPPALHLQPFLCYMVLQMGEQSAFSPKARLSTQTLGHVALYLSKDFISRIVLSFSYITNLDSPLAPCH